MMKTCVLAAMLSACLGMQDSPLHNSGPLF